MVVAKLSDSTDFMFCNFYNDEAQSLLQGFSAHECWDLFEKEGCDAVAEKF